MDTEHYLGHLTKPKMISEAFDAFHLLKFLCRIPAISVKMFGIFHQ